jgi:hypothetical protein
MAMLNTMEAKWCQRAMEKIRRRRISKLKAASEVRKIAAQIRRLPVKGRVPPFMPGLLTGGAAHSVSPVNIQMVEKEVPPAQAPAFEIIVNRPSSVLLEGELSDTIPPFGKVLPV